MTAYEHITGVQKRSGGVTPDQFLSAVDQLGLGDQKMAWLCTLAAKISGVMHWKVFVGADEAGFIHFFALPTEAEEQAISAVAEKYQGNLGLMVCHFYRSLGLTEAQAHQKFGAGVLNTIARLYFSRGLDKPIRHICRNSKWVFTSK